MVLHALHKVILRNIVHNEVDIFIQKKDFDTHHGLDDVIIYNEKRRDNIFSSEYNRPLFILSASRRNFIIYLTGYSESDSHT